MNILIVCIVALAVAAFVTAWALCRIAAIADEYTIHDEEHEHGNH